MQPSAYLGIETKPDLPRAMVRILAWFEGQLTDRLPIRFSERNAEDEKASVASRRCRPLRDRWFDAEYQVLSYLQCRRRLAETNSEYWPNLGAEVYSASHGGEPTCQESTSYSVRLVHELVDMSKFRFDRVFSLRADLIISDSGMAKVSGECI